MEARRRQIGQHQGGKGGSRPFMFRRCCYVSVTSIEQNEFGMAERNIHFYVLPNGSWRQPVAGGAKRSRVRPSEDTPGLTYEDFARAFARHL